MSDQADPNVLESLFNFFSSPGGTSLLTGAAGGLLTKEAYDRLSDIGKESEDKALTYAERAQEESSFKPFTVTTPTGSMFRSQIGSMQPPNMSNDSDRFNRLYDLLQRPGTTPNPIAPPIKTGGPVSPGFTPVLKPMPGTFQPGTVMDAGGAFGSGQGRPAGMPAFRGAPDSQPAADAMARQYEQSMIETIRGGRDFLPTPLPPITPQLPQPGPQSQEGVNVEMSLSPAEQAMFQGLFGGAGNFFGQAQQSTAGREQDIFNRIRDAQRPEEERQNLALEQRLASQGRLGVRTADFGGTPEQLAMSKAQSEARNTAMLGAMQQAQAEQAQQAALGQQFLGASYLPQAQMLNALQPGLAQQQMAQQAQQFGTGLFGETAMSGLEARLIAEQARANLLGGVGSNILSGLMSPQFNKAGNVTSPGGLTGSVDAIKKLLENLGIIDD